MIVLENGMFLKWQSDLIGSYKYRRHLRVKYDEVLSLTLEEISGSFYILISGLILATVIFFIERKI